LTNPKSKSLKKRNNNNWTIFPDAKQTLKDCAEAVTSFKSKNPTIEIKNIALGFHAGNNVLDGENGINYAGREDDDEIVSLHYAYLHDFENFNKGNVDKISDETLVAIRSLQTVINSVSEGGNVYLSACRISDDLAVAISNLSSKKVNIFYTSDIVDLSAIMDFGRIPEGIKGGQWNENQTVFYHAKANEFKEGLSKVTKGEKPQRLGTNFQFNSQGLPVEHPKHKK
jgi:hypothetical protein